MALDFNIDGLLKPYLEGGTQRSPVTRSLRTISNALINMEHFSPEVAGAGIWKVLAKLAAGEVEFKGDGSYGSKGKELYSCIYAQCQDVVERKAVEEVKKQLNDLVGCLEVSCPKRNKKLRPRNRMSRFIRWWLLPRGIWRV